MCEYMAHDLIQAYEVTEHWCRKHSQVIFNVID